MNSRGWIPILLLTAGLTSDPAAAQGARRFGTLDFRPCTLSSSGLPLTIAALCATLDVPEDASRPEGRRIELNSHGCPPMRASLRPIRCSCWRADPGQSARDGFTAVSPAFREILRKRHVILLDQRGTGPGSPLACDLESDGVPTAVADAARPDAARRQAERCLEQVEADPRFFTTSDAVRDLEAVRARLGVEQLNLVGISYGTRLALEYLRRHPSRVRTVVLDGVVPPQLALGAEHARNLEWSLDAQLARCAADSACAKHFGAPREALARLIEELRQAPRRVRYLDPRTAEAREDVLTADMVTGVVRLYAYAPQLAAMLPMAIARAAAGDAALLMAQARMIEDLVGEQLSYGLQLSVTCAEDAPLLEPDPADAGTLLGDGLVTSIKSACAVWPRGEMPSDFHAPLVSDRPVLLLSGEFDPVTPPRYGAQVLRGLRNGRHLVARGQGHNVMTAGCMPRLMAAFIETTDAAGLDAACLEQLSATPPFAGAYGWEP